MAAPGEASSREAPINSRVVGHNASSVLEAESFYGQENDDDIDNSDWKSITSSIIDYEYENGRRYHAFKAGHYPFPNDERELDRLDLVHHVLTLIISGELYLAPLDNPRRVLDIGTGTGLWAIEFADRWPNSSVIGTDLSPIQPDMVPDNVRFEITDVEGDWMLRENYLDYVHSRIMVGSLTDYQETVNKAFHHLKPGGFLEVQEMDPRITSDDGTHNMSKWNVQLFADLCEASAKYGKPVPRHTEYARMLKNAGFVDVKEHYFKIPINTWPKNKQLKEVGKYQALHYTEGLEGISVGLFTRVLGWTHPELQILLAKVRTEIKDRSIHVYQPYCIVYGRKPFPGERNHASAVFSSGSSGMAQPLGTATELRNVGSAANLADMMRRENPESNIGPPQIRIDTDGPQSMFYDKLEADSSTPSTDPSSNGGWS